MDHLVCSVCGAAAYYDGRCGDGAVLTCGCDRRGPRIDDGRGGYYDNPDHARPINAGPSPPPTTTHSAPTVTPAQLARMEAKIDQIIQHCGTPRPRPARHSTRRRTRG
jgi:hypothetical protein